MQWYPNLTGGYFDLEKQRMYRAPIREKESKKRKRPAVIPNKLLPWLKRWKAQDTVGVSIKLHVVTYKGKPIEDINKSFNTTAKNVKIKPNITPHSLRHTSITWAMRRNVPKNVVMSFYNVTERVLDDTYWHHSPDFQKEMQSQN